MVQRTQTATEVLFPFLRYKDAPAAIDWLAKAFGMEEQMVVPGEDGTVAHAELSFRGAVIKLGQATETVEVSGGAEIVRGPENTDYGSREYTARDHEGHLWGFGTYRQRRRRNGGRKHRPSPSQDLSRLAGGDGEAIRRPYRSDVAGAGKDLRDVQRQPRRWDGIASVQGASGSVSPPRHPITKARGGTARRVTRRGIGPQSRGSSTA